MISKVFSGHSFYHACRYICKDDERAQVLATEGVRGHDYRLMAQDFITQQELRSSKKQVCFHSILSFYPGENPGDAKMVEIAKKYLEEIGITNTQYTMVKHIDKAHLHVHIIANMVNNDGQVISDSWIALKGKKAAQELTLKYKLVPAIKKDLALTHLESLTESEANKYKIYMAISESLPQCSSMEELEKRLLKQGIQIQYKYKGQTKEKQGISFKIGTDSFKGSKVDRRFSLGNLEKTIALQQTEALEQKQKQPGASVKKWEMPKTNFQKQDLPGKELAQKVGKGLTNVLEILLKPEETYEHSPYELTEEATRRRKKQSQRRHRL